jgi:glycine/D-amino acid oxidase-like deaminating enzyme
LVLAAGLGNRDLAPLIGLKQAVKPQRGQIMVTEKLPLQMRYPMVTLRQTAEGSMMIGDSHEDAGLDVSSTRPVMAEIASRAERILPALSHAQIVRSWAALRVMSPDGYPIYDQSPDIPGAFAVTCHSGVTLAAAHAFDLARCVHDGHLGPHLTSFSERRFDVSAA